MTPGHPPARLVRLALLIVLLAAAACAGSDPVSPSSRIPSGTASISLAGYFMTRFPDSVSQSNVIARMLREDPIPDATTPFKGARQLVLTWPPTPGLHPEPMGFSVSLPYAYPSLPRTLSDSADALEAGLEVQRVTVGPGSDYYTASSGTVTITSVTDSTLAGTIDLVFARGPVGSNLHMTGSFNATLCNINAGIPCVPPQTY